MEDSEIVALYWARDEQAVAETDGKYGIFCRAMAQNLLGSPEDAEECVSDTWLEAWNSMPEEKPDLLRPWLGRVVRLNAIDRWRSAHRQKRFGGVEDIRREKSKLLRSAAWSLSLDPMSTADCIAGEGGEYWIENVVLHLDGTSFDIVSSGSRLSVRLPLCGRQCAGNALAAYLVARRLGVADADILDRWVHITPDPHRLCPTRLQSGVVVIDDSYNCNILGARYALEYLSLYSGRKIVATSGIDESDPALGLNERLARAIDEVADVVVVVGDRYVASLRQGFVRAKVYEVPDTPAARDLYARLLMSGDTLLVMADYPM